MRLAVRTLKDAVVVPQAAVIQGPRGAIVYTVDAENKAVSQRVEVLYASGPDAVASGVRAGDRIVVEGRQNLRPGATVVERATTGAARSGAAPAPGTGASSSGTGAAVTP